MSQDIDTRLVGVRIPIPMIEKIDERRKNTGISRQDVINLVLEKEFLTGC